MISTFNSTMQRFDPSPDVIIIGAGPAGLTAAIYLGRFRRRCRVLDDAESRARWIPTSHNIPGFTRGIGGEQLLRSMREQALHYGAQFIRGTASTVSRADGEFTIETDQGAHRAPYVLVATGVKDHLPAIPGVPEAIQLGLVRLCPICDAFEAIDKRIAVIGDGALGMRESTFLQHYSSKVTYLYLGAMRGANELEGLRDLDHLVIEPSDLSLHENHVRVSNEAGERDFDVVYLALGCSPQHDLARSVGARCDEKGAIIVNAHQQTTVPGLYAAGDVVRGLNQVIVAAAESAIAATDIHNKLRGL